MTLSALLLDLDGTLLDTNLQHARAWAAAFERHGLSIPVDRIAEEIGKGGELLVPALVGAGVEEEQGEALREAQAEIFLAMIDEEPVAILPGAAEIFAAARRHGLRTAVATAAKRSHLERMVERSGLDLFDLADEVLTDDDVDRPKPRPDVGRAAVGALDLSPAQCAMVGDTPYDGTAARRAGVVCLGVETGGSSEAALRRAWMRAVYADLGALVDDFEAALVVASPATVVWDQGLLEALAAEAAGAAIEVRATGELPDGAVVADGEARVLAHGFRRVRERHDPLAHPALEALAEVAKLRSEEGERGGDGANGTNGAGGARTPLALATVFEPCPLCLGAALVAGVDLVVWSIDDPAAGGSERCLPLDLPRSPPPRLIGGVRTKLARNLLAAWARNNPESPEAPIARRLLASGH